MKLKLFAFISTLILLGVVPYTSAKESSETFRRTEKRGRLEELKEKLRIKKVERCEESTEKVQERIAKFEENHSTHNSRYKNTLIRLEALVTKLNEKGADTTDLASSVDKLDVLITAFDTDFAAFINSLKENRTVSCSSEKGEFQAYLKASRELLAKVKADAEAIKNLFETEIKPELKALRQPKQESSESEKD